jgi:ATP-dependent Clp protease ATP-binding subunit ClpC
METLCRRTKRNPLLVGPAGTGKTAIVEGLAQRIVKGEVPLPLKGVRLISIQPSSLVAGAGIVGELEKRLGAILAEADQDGVLIFIDEVHAIMGAGGREGTGDMASMIKPALARGDIACIAATTNDEYRKFIEADRALERRFQPIRVEELSPAQTLEVLKSVRDDLVKGRNVEVGDDLLVWLVDVAKRFMPNRYFPDKAVDLLDQTIAYGVTRQLTKIEQSHADEVVRRMLGMPSLERVGLDQMRASLVSRGLVSQPDADLLVERLEVTTRGLDLRAARPNAVVLLTGELVDSADEIATTIAEGVYGSADRVVRVDLGRLQDDSDSNVLLGSPPGYIGYSDRHALDALAEMPWSVVLCMRADLCHRSVLAALTPGISTGVVTDMRGRRIYFSDAVVILTTATVSERRRAVGFGSQASEDARDQTADELLGQELASTIDFVFSERPGNAETNTDWITTRLLPEMAARHRERGVELVWDPSVVDWLAAEWKTSRDTRGLERQMENQIGAALVRELYSGATPVVGRCVVKRQSATVVVERVKS